MRTYWEGTGNSSQFSVMTCMGRESRKEGIYAYTWASLVAQMVRNPPAMQETWVWSLVWEDPLEKGMATCSSILAWIIPWTEDPGGLQSMGCKDPDVTEWLTLFCFCFLPDPGGEVLRKDFGLPNFDHSPIHCRVHCAKWMNGMTESVCLICWHCGQAGWRWGLWPKEGGRGAV